jgi:hypothetical protein
MDVNITAILSITNNASAPTCGAVVSVPVLLIDVSQISWSFTTVPELGITITQFKQTSQDAALLEIASTLYAPFVDAIMVPTLQLNLAMQSWDSVDISDVLDISVTEFTAILYPLFLIGIGDTYSPTSNADTELFYVVDGDMTVFSPEFNGLLEQEKVCTGDMEAGLPSFSGDELTITYILEGEA